MHCKKELYANIIGKIIDMAFSALTVMFLGGLSFLKKDKIIAGWLGFVCFHLNKPQDFCKNIF